MICAIHKQVLQRLSMFTRCNTLIDPIVINLIFVSIFFPTKNNFMTRVENQRKCCSHLYHNHRQKIRFRINYSQRVKSRKSKISKTSNTVRSGNIVVKEDNEETISLKYLNDARSSTSRSSKTICTFAAELLQLVKDDLDFIPSHYEWRSIFFTSHFKMRTVMQKWISWLRRCKIIHKRGLKIER